MPLVTIDEKELPLTHAEMDENFCISGFTSLGNLFSLMYEQDTWDVISSDFSHDIPGATESSVELYSLQDLLDSGYSLACIECAAVETVGGSMGAEKRIFRLIHDGTAWSIASSHVVFDTGIQANFAIDLSSNSLVFYGNDTIEYSLSYRIYVS